MNEKNLYPEGKKKGERTLCSSLYPGKKSERNAKGGGKEGRLLTRRGGETLTGQREGMGGRVLVAPSEGGKKKRGGGILREKEGRWVGGKTRLPFPRGGKGRGK